MPSAICVTRFVFIEDLKPAGLSLIAIVAPEPLGTWLTCEITDQGNQVPSLCGQYFFALHKTNTMEMQADEVFNCFFTL